MKELNERQLDIITKATFEKTAKIGLENASKNIKYIKNNILEIKPDNKKTDSAIVIAAGPSLHLKNSISRIISSGYKGDIVAVDGSLGSCLRAGLIPDYVITVDPHPTRIVRWFGDTKLDKREPDDYYRHQDMDPVLTQNEVERNRELINIVNKHGNKINAVISTSVATDVTLRCIEAGMKLFWWNPIYDDYEKDESYTNKIYNLTKVPCMATGGNCGTSAWIFAHTILKKKRIALVGMDLSYAPTTPLRNTQYYKQLVELFGDRAKDAYIKIYNPHINETWYTDPTYYWYRQCFLEILKDMKCTTYNCTEGGIVFGDGVQFISLEEFVKEN